MNFGPPSDGASPQAGPELTEMAQNQPTPQSEVAQPNAAYLRFIDNTRKAVAIAMVVCGPLLILCARRDDFLRVTLRRDSGIWYWGCVVFGIGVWVCLILSLLLILEYLARPATSKPFTWRKLSARCVLIVIMSAAICYAVVIGYGVWQGVGAIISTLLILAAVRERGTLRAALAVSAIIALGLTVLGTQSTYQYARRHADEIIAAGTELLDRFPNTAATGGEISPHDSLVPDILRELRPQRIWINEEHVSVHLGGGDKFDVYPASGSIVYNPFPKTGGTKITAGP